MLRPCYSSGPRIWAERNCPPFSQDRSNFCNSQEGAWLEPGDYSIPPHITFQEWGKGSLPCQGSVVWSGIVGFKWWWTFAYECIAYLVQFSINIVALTLCFLPVSSKLFLSQHIFTFCFSSSPPQPRMGRERQEWKCSASFGAVSVGTPNWRIPFLNHSRSQVSEYIEKTHAKYIKNTLKVVK